ncbi:MAG: tRNA lysidine(34) synthetase TilS [Solirubrobacterales bacterium]|nr:tRNA lysidine(34) synthetase TilS [Solirubrobacterales bacterium]
MPAADREFNFEQFRGKPVSVIAGAIEDSELVGGGDRGVVLVSGGADSVALLTGLWHILGPDRLVALHVNYGLRDEAGSDEALVREICGQLGIELLVHRAGEPAGNIQAWARSVRLEEAERVRSEWNFDWIAIGHNRTDQAETFLYRLASSPGVRALLAMPPRSGRIIRPLLGLDRGTIRQMLEDVTPWAEDSTNDDLRFARNRIRHGVLQDLGKVNPAAGLNIARTRAELEEDEDALAELAKAALESAAFSPESGLEGAILDRRHPAVRRRILRHLAERELGRPVAMPRELASSAEQLLADPEGGELDLGGGDRFVIEQGRVLVVPGVGTGIEEIPLPVPVSLESGIARFGDWEVESRTTDEAGARGQFGDPWSAFFGERELRMWLSEAPPSPDDLLLALRPWQHGDRVEPLGMSGRKKLQDVFTDALVPASRRRSWPVLAIGETVLWVPGLVRSKHLLIQAPDTPVLHLYARAPFGK